MHGSHPNSLLALATLAAVACANVRGRAEHTPEAALQLYNDALLRMDFEAMAAWYAPDGELAWADEPPIRGPAAILAHLRRFESYRVEASRMTPDAVSVGRASARQEGLFWQRTRLPDGRTVEASGRFTAEWSHGGDGTWRLRRLVTRPP